MQTGAWRDKVIELYYEKAFRDLGSGLNEKTYQIQIIFFKKNLKFFFS